MTSNDSYKNNNAQRIERVHREAVTRGDHHYMDPVTGFLVMTELHHLERGECCDNGCRHCPFRDTP